MSFCQILREFFPAHEMVIATDFTGKKIIVHKSQWVECADCGEFFLKTEMYENCDGELICESCKRDYFYCDDCGKLTRYYTVVNHGEKCVCETCLEEYSYCEFCETYSSSGSTDEGETFACSQCQSNGTVTMCECCSYWSRTYNYTADDYRLCNRCFELYTTECVDCGAIYYYEDNLYENDYGDLVCPDCNAERHETIKSYNYKPYPEFHKIPGEDTKEFFGFEIEVCGSQEYAREFKNIVGHEIYLKRDGSVPGFEIVSHPMTRKYFDEVFRGKLALGMNFLKKKQFSAHNKAGIHIHVSSEAISSEMLKRMMDLLYQTNPKNRDIWRKITQRKQCELDRWASMRTESLVGATKKELKETIDYFERNSLGKPVLGKERYTALNTRNKNTVEFRIFNSNLRIERIAKNLQVVESIIDFSKMKTSVSVKHYLEYVFRHKKDYPDLCDFLIEKNIYNPNATDLQLVFDFEDDDDNERVA